MERRNADAERDQLDYLYVGGPFAPPSGSTDLAIIRWASEQRRLIVSRDANTLIAAHTRFVAEGNATAGLLILRDGLSVADLVEWLDLFSTEDHACCDSTTQFFPPQ